VHRGSPADTGRVASAFALRNANMLSFEADRQAWRGTSRTYADAGGADLAHKLAVVADGVFKLLRAAWDRDHREDTTSQIKLHALCGSSARNSASARREAGRAKLHRLQHAFPGSLVNLCACPGWSCGCRAGGADDDTHETCCEGAGLSQSPHTASAIAHTPTDDNFYTLRRENVPRLVLVGK
jgi:hypothetical protein